MQRKILVAGGLDILIQHLSTFTFHLQTVVVQLKAIELILRNNGTSISLKL